MNVDRLDPPRTFDVGITGITLAHCADVRLDPDEMVTFLGPEGREYDVTRKSWGYYATPSLAGRLIANGFRAALVRNVDTRQCFVVLVDTERVEEWRDYNRVERQEVVLWLDDFDRLARLAADEPAGSA